MYGGALVGFGGAYPILASDPHEAHASVREDGTGVTNDALERAEATAEAAVDDAGISGAERVAEVGDPPEAILRAAREHDIDVIVVGDHDRSWWSELFAPAVGTTLIERAEVPVLVVSRDAADASPLGEGQQFGEGAP
jgi:nucleotide-binding universal stress UspA family protein